MSDLKAGVARVEGYHGMTNFTDEDIRALVEERRVHRSVYLDADLFELEMERIFGRSWVFVGHDSQVAKPGDFLCTRIGLQPVILVRHSDGTVRVLYNRCGHRGAEVVTEESGHATHFRCGYHGWTYETDGTLFAAPMPELYPDDFALDDRRFGMAELPRVASYRGFVFASLCPEGPDLATHLGNATLGIDELLARAPEGEVEFICRFNQNGEEQVLHERSRFRRDEGTWRFVDGQLVKAKPLRRESPKVGRNDPCPCGSGKKFKKCCIDLLS